jgi:hypothetical protein
MNKLETDNTNNNVTDVGIDVNSFNKVFQPRTEMVQDENDNLLPNVDSVLKRRFLKC